MSEPSTNECYFQLRLQAIQDFISYYGRQPNEEETEDACESMLERFL